MHRGQLGAIERGSKVGDDCARVVYLTAASCSAINPLMGKVLERHLREHVVDPAKRRSAAPSKGVQQLIDVRYSYLA
jgi:DNA-binding FrmR family transcriptional regulator